MKAPWAKKQETSTGPSGAGTSGATKTSVPAARPVVPPVDRTAPKGRPTPKRRDAQPRRTGYVAPPPTTSKEARARSKEKNKLHRAEVKAGRAVNEPPALTRRDAGPERKLVRDLVDSKRHLASYFPLFAVILLVFYFTGAQTKNVGLYNVISLVWLVAFLAIIVESVFLGRSLRRRVHAEFPKTQEKTRSLSFYGIMRALMFRKGRYPKPVVAMGAKV